MFRGFSFFMSIRLQDLLQRSNERVHLLVRADRDTQVIVDARQFEIPDEDTLFTQGGENFGRRLFGWVANRKLASDGVT